MNAEHPWRKKFLIDLSQAIFIQHQVDQQKLVEARRATRLEGPRTERVKFIRRVVGALDNVAERMLLVLKAHKELDNQCRSQAVCWAGGGESVCCGHRLPPSHQESDRSVFNIRVCVTVCVRERLCVYVCVSVCVCVGGSDLNLRHV